MQLSDAAVLIKKAISSDMPQYWADLGSGAGTFTKALFSLLPPGSRITAIDRESQQFSEPEIDFYRADFVADPLPLKNIDGLLMANSFHYVRDKATLVDKLETCFTDSTRFLFVEYDTSRSNPWVPYPIPFNELKLFFANRGYRTEHIGERKSRYGGTMYSALVTKL
jgi:trans-aconitate methyltransferase